MKQLKNRARTARGLCAKCNHHHTKSCERVISRQLDGCDVVCGCRHLYRRWDPSDLNAMDLNDFFEKINEHMESITGFYVIGNNWIGFNQASFKNGRPSWVFQEGTDYDDVVQAKRAATYLRKLELPLVVLNKRDKDYEKKTQLKIKALKRGLELRLEKRLREEKRICGNIKRKLKRSLDGLIFFAQNFFPDIPHIDFIDLT